MTGPEGITATIAEEGQQGIHLVTVGYGMGNYNDHLMEQLADQGDGFYRYVDTYEEARHLYVDELTSLLTPVADDARTQVEFDPELVSSYRLVGYDNRAHGRRVVRGPRGRRRRARGRPPRDGAVRGAAGRRASRPGTQIGTARLRWVSAATRAPGSAEAPVLAADPEVTPSDSFALATAAADLAELVKLGGYARDDSGRTTSYGDLRARVDGAGRARGAWRDRPARPRRRLADGGTD